MSGKKIKVVKDCIGVCFIVSALYFLVRAFLLTFSVDIWYDELFSMEFAKRSFSELISLTSRDVHPPLYYIIVRIFLLMGNGIGVPLETIAKSVSIVPFLLMFIYGVTFVRKNFGLLSCGIFCFAIVTMPGLPEYTTEIRMYSWAMFFVTAFLIHALNLMRNYLNGTGKWDLVNGAAIYLYGTAAFYTHYYAALSVGIIYSYVFIWMIVVYVKVMRDKVKGKKPLNLKMLSTLIISANLSAVSYIPWLSVLFGQVNTVSSNYWIQPVGIRTFGSCIKYLFSGYFTNSLITVIIAVILFALSAFTAVYNIYRLIKRQYEDEIQKIRDFQSLIAIAVLPMLAIVGIIASILIRPVFVNRYMIPALGAFYLALSIGIGRTFVVKKVSRPIQIAFCIFGLLIAIVGITDFNAFIGNEEYRRVNMKKTAEFFDELDSDTLIISNFNQVQALLAYYLNNDETEDEHKIYLYYGEPEVLVDDMLSGLYTIEDSVDVKNYLLSGKRVLFLGSFNSREVILNEWNEDYGITYENLGSFLMERYWFDVFELSL